MGRMQTLAFLIVLIILAVLLVIYINLPSNFIPEMRYSENPKNWIESSGNVLSVDVDEVTEGAGYVDSIGLQYNDKKISTAFRQSGFYKGRYFDEVYYNEDGKMLMRINKDMTPYDGVIEGFIIEKIKNGKPIVYVFVDEDWKKNIGRTYIRYGRNFEKKKILVFNEVTKGIYTDSFEDDISRFMDDYSIHFGGVIVGDISDEKIAEEDTDITLMKIE